MPDFCINRNRRHFLVFVYADASSSTWQEKLNIKDGISGVLPLFSFHVSHICSLHMSLFVLPVSDEEVVNCNFFNMGAKVQRLWTELIFSNKAPLNFIRLNKRMKMPWGLLAPHTVDFRPDIFTEWAGGVWQPGSSRLDCFTAVCHQCPTPTSPPVQLRPFYGVHLLQLQTTPTRPMLSCVSSVSGLIFPGSGSSGIAQEFNLT